LSVQNGFFRKSEKKFSKSYLLESASYKKNEKIFQKTFGGKEKVFTFALPIENERAAGRKRKAGKRNKKSSLKILETALSKARKFT
jgi:hypothetical protein